MKTLASSFLLFFTFPSFYGNNEPYSYMMINHFVAANAVPLAPLDGLLSFSVVTPIFKTHITLNQAMKH